MRSYWVNHTLLEKLPAALRSEVHRVFEEGERAVALLEKREQAFELLRKELTEEILRLRQLVRLYQIDKFGASSEKLTDSQMALLNLEPSVSEEEVQAEAHLPEAQKTVAGAPALENLAEETRRAHSPSKVRSRKPAVRQEFPAELPRRERQIEAAPEACRCRVCGAQTRVIGYEESERLSVEPVRYFVEVTKREKRACPRCPEGGVSTAPMPSQIVEKGVFSNALVVDVLEKKYATHLPLYRQAQQIARDSGYAPSRSTLSDCVLEAGASLRLVKEAMKAELFSGGYIQADETRVPVQVRTREGVNHTGYFWQYSRPGGPVVYDFQMDRGRNGPKAFLEHYGGILQTDGYTAYDKVGGEGIRRACCLAHVRRRFYETLQGDPGNVEAGFVLLKIGEIYAVEKEAREAGMDADGRGRLRAQRSVELLGQLRELVVGASRKALPKSLLGRACQYALGLWPRLEEIFRDGRIEVDNNWVENGMRAIALGRKNWLHIGSEMAGHRVAAVASVVESCKRGGIGVRDYLESVLPGLNEVPARSVGELTPHAWQRSHGKTG